MVKATLFFFGLLFLFFTAALAEAKDVVPQKIFSVSLTLTGNVLGDVVNEKITLTELDPAELSSLSMFPNFTSEENAIGSFRAKLASSYFQKALELAKKAMVYGKNPILPDSILATLDVNRGAAKVEWMLGSDKPALSALETFYSDVRKVLISTPHTAMKLLCKKDGGKLSCFYKNIGTQEIKCIDPLGVNNGILCVDADGNRNSLLVLKEQDPRKMAPKSITLQPSLSYSFSVPLSGPCQRVVVKTSLMRQNPKYGSLLLGDLVSAKLE